MTTKRERQEQKVEEHIRDIGEVMSTAPGRRFIWSLVNQFNVFSSSFSTDAGLMAHQEGVRAAGISIMKSVMDHHPDQYMVMMTEHRPILKQFQDLKDEPEPEHDPFSR